MGGKYEVRTENDTQFFQSFIPFIVYYMKNRKNVIYVRVFFG